MQVETIFLTFPVNASPILCLSHPVLSQSSLQMGIRYVLGVYSTRSVLVGSYVSC